MSVTSQVPIEFFLYAFHCGRSYDEGWGMALGC